MTDLVIRKANPSDWQTLQSINHTIFAINLKFSEGINPDWEYTSFGETYFKKLCNDTSIETQIAYKDDHAVGYINGFIQNEDYHLPPHDKVAIVENLGVLPEYQKQGIAKSLYERFARWCKDQGIVTISVESYYQNKNAISFYQSLGFTPSDLVLKKTL